MTDVVYVLNGKSKYGNEEIRYSIRSMWQYGRNLGRLCIVGQRPSFLNVWKHIPSTDLIDPVWCKDINIAHDILLACADPEISDPFIFLSDDNFMIRTFDADAFPAYYMDAYKPDMSSTYERAVHNTFMILWGLGYARLINRFFDIHLPIPIHKKCMIDAFARFDWRNQPFTVKTIYANQCDRLVPVKTTDCKIRNPKSFPTCPIGFSTNDEITPELWTAIKSRYPSPSKWEKKS